MLAELKSYRNRRYTIVAHLCQYAREVLVLNELHAPLYVSRVGPVEEMEHRNLCPQGYDMSDQGQVLRFLWMFEGDKGGWEGG